MRSLLVFIFRLILLALFTFGFVVLFEHGAAKFSEGAKAEWNALLFFAGSVLSKQENVRAAPQPATPATPSPAQKRPPPSGADATTPVPGTPAPNR